MTTRKVPVSPEVQRMEYFNAMYAVALRRGMAPKDATKFAQAQLNEQARIKLEADQEKARLRAKQAKERRQNKSKEKENAAP